MDNRDMIQRSLDYIEENIQTEITATELAGQAGFSLFHYYRLFQQATGLPVMQYILRRRLLHGVYAMTQGTTKTNAALRFGFDTYAGFYKAFCREFGATPSDFLEASRAKRPYRIDITKEEHMTITHKKAAQILKHWNLGGETIADIYYEGTGNKNDSACYVGEEYVLKYTANPGKLMKHIEVSKALENIGLLAPVTLETTEGQEYVRDGELYFYLTKRLPGKQLASHRFGEGNARFVGEIIGQLHLALSKIDGCVSDGDLLSTVRDWALPKAKEVLHLPDSFCTEDRWGFIDFDLSERNVRIYDPCYTATAVLSEVFGKDKESWLEVYRNIICGYDSVAALTEDERKAIPYVILANQFICVAWFAEQDKYAELFDINKKMTLWLIEQFGELKNRS